MRLLSVLIVAGLLIVGLSSLGFMVAMRNSPNAVVGNQGSLHLVYVVKTYGKLSDTVLNTMFNVGIKDVLKKVGMMLPNANTSFKFYVQLYSNYTKYLRYKELSWLSGNTTLMKELSTCRIASNDVVITVDIYKDKVMKLTLSFIDGVALCDDDYKPLPLVNTRWVKVGKFYTSRFKYLNMSREVFLNNKLGLVRDSHGYILGSPIFKLAKCLSRCNESIILYSIEDEGIVKIKGKYYPLADIAYIARNNSSFRGKGIRVLGYEGMPKGLMLRETKYEGLPKELVNELVKLFKSRIILNIPPFIKYYEASTNEGVVIRWRLLVSKIPKACNPWLNIRVINTTKSVARIGNYSVTVSRVYYGLELNGKLYALELHPGLNSIVYTSGGILRKCSMSAEGRLSEALPSIITRTFGIGDEALVNASRVILELASTK